MIPQVGDRILARPNHWARSSERGTVTEVEHKGRFLIRFDRPGIGFDSGYYLRLDQNDFELLHQMKELKGKK